MLNKSLQTSTLSSLKQKSRLSLLGLASAFILCLGMGVESAKAMTLELGVDPAAMPRRTRVALGELQLSFQFTNAKNTASTHPTYPIGYKPLDATKTFWVDMTDRLPTDQVKGTKLAHDDGSLETLKAGDILNTIFIWEYWDDNNDLVPSTCTFSTTLTEKDVSDLSLKDIVLANLPKKIFMDGYNTCTSSSGVSKAQPSNNNTTQDSSEKKESK